MRAEHEHAGHDERREHHVAQRQLGPTDAVEQRRTEEAERAQHADEAQDPCRIAARSRAPAASTCPPE